MPRQIKIEHVQSFVEEWEPRLRSVPWHTLGARTGAQRLVALLALDGAELTARQRKKLQLAVLELQRLLSTPADADSRDPASAELAGWLEHHLLKPGDALLVPEERRRAFLVNVRDRARRAVHRGKGLQAAHIEMPEDAWTKLDLIAEALNLPTRGRAVRHLIETVDLRKLDRRRSAKATNSMGDLLV